MESRSPKPQNTNTDGEEDIVDLCRRLDTKLEEKARMHNLNALNVKSILNRLIKNPNVLTTLMGIEGDTDDIPSIKVTRSKVKHSAAEAAKVELKPIRPPRTFLDVQFDDEDDDDEDYRPEEVNNEGGDEEEGNETSTAVDPNQIRKDGMSASSADHPSNAIGDHETEHGGTEESPYQLRSRVPHIDDSCPLESLNTSFTEESFETFACSRGQEMLTFVENPDYLDFLQGIHASTPVNENENTTVDDDDPDDEEYNVLTELEGLKSIEKDADELRMDRFTEIPKREVEGLFLDLIGSDMETIGPELMLQKIPSPKKKHSKRRSGETGRVKQSNSGRKMSLPVDEPPPDGSYSSSLISGNPIKFKVEELEQLCIQLEQHVQLLTQSVVMCYHDERLTHVKNQYQLMINELDSWYYASGESSFFNISNLSAAIESCHDIMGITPVAQEHVKWEPTPFGWSPRPEAALALGRSRAVIYPDLLPGVQPDLFAFPHQFFTAGEDLLLAHALIQFRHISHSNSQDPFGRLYWVQRMLLPCKTVRQIRNHLRVARQHTEGRVNQRNPVYQIIIQALRGACHLRFPFERPVVRYETLQMWPEEERPIWYNKFVKNFTTNGPTVIVPIVVDNDRTSPGITTSHASVDIISKVDRPATFPNESHNAVASSTISYKVDVRFHRNGAHLKTGVDARPVSLCYESVTGSFPSSCAIRPTQHQQNTSHLFIICFPNAPSSERANARDCSDVHQQPTRNSTVVVDGAEPDVSASSLDVQLQSTSSLLAEPQFSIFEPSKEFSIQPTVKYEEQHLPKSEFSLETELEEGEIVSDENSQDTPTAPDQRYSSKNYSSKRARTECQRGHTRRKWTAHVAEFVYTPLKRRRDSNKSTGKFVIDGKSWHAPTRRDLRYSSRDYSPNRTRIGRERADTDTRRKQAANDSKFMRTSLKRKTDCNKKSIGRNNSRPSRNNENLSRQTFRHLEAHRLQNEVQGAAIRVRSKRRFLSPEWGLIGCLNKRRRDLENTRVKKDIGTSNEDQHVVLKGHKRGSNYWHVGGRFENNRPEGINDRKRIRRSTNDRKSSYKSNSEVQRNFSQSYGEIHEISCDTVCTLRASDRNASVSRVNVNNDLVTLEKDIAAERRVGTLNNSEYGEIEDDFTESNCSTHSANTEEHAKSSSKTWKDSDYTNDEYDNDPLTSDMETDSPMREFESPFIPRTPTFNTPSDYSPVESISHLRTPSFEYDVGIPVTPRDDVLTRSPTLLRAPSAVSRALFSKIQIKRLPTDKADLDNCETSSNCLKDTWDFVEGEQINDDSEDAPGSEMYSAGDELDVASKTRMKRRTRTEKERMGLERMQSPHHRALQMINLARKIADDIKQRTFMHQDVWHTVERIVLGEESMEAQFDRLKAALLPKHTDVLVLLSLLADESVLPPELLTSPLRRAYHGAVQMLLAIEAYYHGTRSRSSNTRSLLKTIGSMGKTLSEVEFCDRLADLLGNERPLWNYIRHWLPLAYDEKVTAADFEFIDLCRRTDSELIEDGGAECIDDLNAVLGPQPPRKGGSLQVHAGQLNSLHNGVYVPILVSKAKKQNGQRRAVENDCNEPVWTKEVDMLILNTYNDIDGTNEDIVKELVRKIPYSRASIERRLNFLISLF